MKVGLGCESLKLGTYEMTHIFWNRIHLEKAGKTPIMMVCSTLHLAALQIVQCTGSVSTQMAAVILYFCLIWLQYNVYHCWPLQWWISDNMQDVQYSANVLSRHLFFWICCFQWARLPCKFVYVKDCYWLLFILQLILFTERPHGFQLGQLEKRKCSLWFKPKDFHLTEVWFYVIITQQKVNKECRQWAWWKFHFNLCVHKTFFLMICLCWNNGNNYCYI